jgi:cell division protein FtsN
MASETISKSTWCLSLILVLGFIGFIYYLSTIPLQLDHRVIDTPKSHSTEVGAGVSKASGNSPETLDQLDFYQLLKEQRVSVTPTPQDHSAGDRPTPITKGTRYILQAGSFSKKADAERLRATLLLEGFNATTEAVKVKGREYHRVYVGPFQIDRQLQRAKRALAELKLSPLVIKQG